MTSGAASGTDGVWSLSRGRDADIMARLAGPIDVPTRRYRRGTDRYRDASGRRQTVAMVVPTQRIEVANDMTVVLSNRFTEGIHHATVYFIYRSTWLCTNRVTNAK
jgi:hypothetical protein